MKIRPMLPEDLDEVTAIENGCFTDPWSRQSFADSLEQKNADLLVVEEEKGHVAGYCCIYRVMDEGEIVNVAVSPEYRKQGYGVEMVGRLIRQSGEAGVRRFFLEVRESNIAGQKLYERLGFAACGKRRGFYEQPKEDAVLMSLQTD